MWSVFMAMVLVRLRARVQFDEPVGNVRGVAVCHHTFTFFELNEL